MKLDVVFTPGELAAGELAGRAAVVVDVLRATSTIVEALANGARAVFPVATADEAVRLARNLGRSEVLLCGERRMRPIEGFDLGNSPGEFTRERVEGKLLAMSTTNGTPALAAVAAAERAVVAALSNLEAAAAALAAEEAVTVVCAGRERRFALEDAVCAGALVLRLQERQGKGLRTNDAAGAAAALARRYGRALERTLAGTAAGRGLVEAGYGEDIAACADTGRHAVVPELKDGQISL